MNTSIQLMYASPDIQVRYEDFARAPQQFTCCTIEVPPRSGTVEPVRIQLFLPYQARLNQTVTVEEV